MEIIGLFVWIYAFVASFGFVVKYLSYEAGLFLVITTGFVLQIFLMSIGFFPTA